jgi:peroxiredoxin Q/BCP
MNSQSSRHAKFLALAAVLILSTNSRADDAPKPPKVGDTIKDYKFDSKTDHEVSLSAFAQTGPLVLVVLRGYPGYQCPACTAQVAELRKHASEFKELGAHVLLVYPGAVDNLQIRATQFLQDEKLPEPLVLVLDPQYAFIQPIGLRWDKSGETAYPSTFVLDKNRVVKFAKVSKTHGDRAKTNDILAVLQKMNVAGAKGKEIPQTR